MVQSLWFDVEKRYNTTVDPVGIDIKSLWFDVEKRYNTTNNVHYVCGMSCGLMQRNDIIQLSTP